MAKTDPEPPNPTRRERAPTITIDTSAVSLASDMKSLPLQLFPNESRSSQDDQATAAVSEPNIQSANVSPIELKPAPSFESRPTSQHNVSSPASRGNDRSNTFLSVPGKRSAGNSLDWEDGSRSSSSYGGETFLSGPSTSLQGGGHPHQDGDGGVDSILHDEDALQPDPGTEGDFSVEDNKFAYTVGHMLKLFNPKSPAAFYALGGLKGIERGLRSDTSSGLSLDETTLPGYITFDEAKAAHFNDPKLQNTDILGPVRTDTQTAASRSGRRSDESFADRKRVFSENRLPEKKTKNILELAWIAYNDNVLILLTVAAVISLGLGLYQALGQQHKNGEARVEWVEGVAIMAAVIIVVVVGAANDWQKERQFVKLNKKKEDRTVKVIRSGKPREISVYDLLVGDVMILEPGDLVPVDGIFISGHNVKCDESSATGESDLLRKRGGEEVFRAIENHEEVRALDPFIISGSKVSEGTGTFLVTAVGVNSSYGKTMMALTEDTEVTPLQKKLNVLAEYIAKLGGAAALLLFIVVFIKFLVQLRGSTATSSEKGQNFLQILIVAITVVVVAVPEGLPLAVTLALAFATTRMLKDNNLVRHLRACETMGNATTICSDKTGTLTQNKMTVVAGSVGTVSRFGDRGVSSLVEGKEVDDHSTAEFLSVLSDEVKVLLMRSIAINSTAFEGEQDGQQVFIGSRTETALLLFARNYLGMGPVQVEHANAKIAQVVPFDSARKCMASIVKLDDGRYRMYVKGASEILLEKCDKIIQSPSTDISETRLTKDNYEALSRIISTYASRSLRTIALLYRDFEQWPPKGARVLEDDPTQANFDSIFNEMTFLGIVGIQDPLREGVKEAVLDCQKAGVKVRMVTGDNIMTARAIAEECGIFTTGGLVMEGPKFRKLSRTEMDHAIPRLQVLARSSPEDKRILVKRLKELGETVAVTGDGTNDAPALKTADVGFSMGIAGTEVAKEASAIILMDDNFSSIVKAIMWGRAVNDAVKKFLQFQITVNITAVVLTFVSAVASSTEQSVLTAVQLLWVNLIMDTFAALALATDAPNRSILNRKPDRKSAPLITLTMWKMIIGQAIYQLVVTFILNFGGESILSYQSEREKAQLKTLVFNTFVWMQIFNQYNNRRLDNGFDIFEGVQRNPFFAIINLIMIGGQVLIIFIGGRALSVRRLNGAQWAYSIILGALSLPMAVIIRLIPDELIRKLIPHRWQHKETPDVVVSDDEPRFEWNPALVEIREELAFLKKVRRGRLNAVKFKLQHPREIIPGSRNGSRSRSSSFNRTQMPSEEKGPNETGSPGPATPESRNRRRTRSRSNSAFGPATAMAGIVAGSIAGWSPIERPRGDNDSLLFSKTSHRSDTDTSEGIEMRPSTKAEDQVAAEDPYKYRGTTPTQTDKLPAVPAPASTKYSPGLPPGNKETLSSEPPGYQKS
ncbi:MAG: hypothetical protein M1840_008984 [Geoglossum simile]|nr:MAG: hypothetical protein M1840_008984 [Geoglossum simile]